ncbi:MAG: hypothetical protein AAF824_13865 [Bacteroidota bacterium]
MLQHSILQTVTGTVLPENLVSLKVMCVIALLVGNKEVYDQANSQSYREAKDIDG